MSRTPPLPEQVFQRRRRIATLLLLDMYQQLDERVDIWKVMVQATILAESDFWIESAAMPDPRPEPVSDSLFRKTKREISI